MPQGQGRARNRLPLPTPAAPTEADPTEGSPDPGWLEIGWDEALDTVAANLRRIAAAHGPETVAFANASLPALINSFTNSGRLISDSPWL